MCLWYVTINGKKQYDNSIRTSTSTSTKIRTRVQINTSGSVLSEGPLSIAIRHCARRSCNLGYFATEQQDPQVAGLGISIGLLGSQNALSLHPSSGSIFEKHLREASPKRIAEKVPFGCRKLHSSSVHRRSYGVKALVTQGQARICGSIQLDTSGMTSTETCFHICATCRDAHLLRRNRSVETDQSFRPTGS